ncbi:MAG TPA: PQQ-dependent sugar dehydrogenase [Chitinophagaceae bacterium]
MLQIKKVFAFGLLLFIASGCLFAQDGKTIYKTYCAGCHGALLQGNTAAKLIKTEWKYGRDRGAIIRNIKFGIKSTDMNGFGKILKDEDINSVADFVIASQKVPPDAVRPIPNRLTTKDYILKVEKLVTKDINTPWGIEFVDTHRALITERNGGIRWMVDGKLDPEPIKGLPKTYAQSTGGYMDIALDPDYAKNGWVYFAFSESMGNSADKNAAGMTKVVRGKIEDHQWTNEQTLFEVADSLKVAGGNRWGCRLLFDRQGYLYFSIGDMARAMDSQDPGKPSGKVFRINPDGSIPKDNPFVEKKGALPAVFTIGNRNVQGIALHPVTGQIWATEHGPMGGDELNILRKGANYGWPLITYGVDYSGDIVSRDTKRAGMEQPIVQWTPSIAVCPAEFVTGTLFSKWKNNLLVGALAFEEIRRLVIENNKVTKQEIILKGVGRVRDLKTGPDGALYVLLNNPDMVLRISPEKKL